MDCGEVGVYEIEAYLILEDSHLWPAALLAACLQRLSYPWFGLNCVLLLALCQRPDTLPALN